MGPSGRTDPTARICHRRPGSARAFTAAAELIGDYFVSMAQRVYGRDTATTQDCNVVILAR
jgi:hypothetical protein